MNKLFLLIKITLLATLDTLGSGTNGTKKENQKKLSSLGVMGIVFGIALFYSFMINLQFASALAPFNLMHIQMGLMMAITSVMTLFFSVGMVQNAMFEFKDYDMLMSLPVSTKTIIITRFIVIYLSNIIFTAIIMLPAFVVYILNTAFSATFVLSFLATIFVIPFIPIIIATVIGTIVAFCSSRFKATKHISTVFLFLIFIGIMFLSFNYGNSIRNFDEIGTMLLESVNSIYPLTGLYVEGVCEGNFISLLLFIAIAAVLFVAYVYIVATNFVPLYESVNKKPTTAKYKMTKQKTNSILASLIKKELTIYFSSQPYLFNTFFGMVMLVIGVVVAVIYKDTALQIIANMGMPINTVFALVPVFMGFMISLSCTTPYTISFEGKSLWVIKSCPVDVKTVFISKLAVTWIITIPLIILTAITGLIVYGYGIDIFLLFLITPTLITLFSSFFGLVINLNHPNLDWTNEAVIVKNSAATLFYVFIQMGIFFSTIFGSILLVSINIIPPIAISLGISFIYLVLVIVFYKILTTKGVKQFTDLS